MLQAIRKIFILFLASCLIFFAAAAYARFIEPERLTIRHIAVETQQSIEPCRAVFFTDTHFGRYYGTNHAQKIVQAINSVHPDVVIFGGDLFDNYARDRESLDLTLLAQTLATIEAPAGKYAVWGNHDYGGGAVRIYESFLSSCGFVVLDDESVLLDGYNIRLFGYDDALMGWTDPSLYTIENSGFNLIAAHEPSIARLIQGGGDNYLLSGHTHGGQVSIPFLTDRFLPAGSDGFRKGFYSAQEIGSPDVRMYVSSGIGMTRYPLRFLNPPELLAIDLRPSPAT